jgi:hypothetical protein
MVTLMNTGMTSNQTMALLLLGVESTDAQNSFGHAFLAGMKFDVQMLKSCQTARDKKSCLLTRKNTFGQMIPELYTCSFYPDGQLRNDHRDIKRVDRMYFKKETPFPGDEFLTKVVPSELIDELFVGTTTTVPLLYIDHEEFRYNLFLNNCIAFSAEQFEKYAGIRLENSTEVFFQNIYLPNFLADSIRKYKNADEHEQAAKFKPKSYYGSEQFVKDIDIHNEAGLLERLKNLGID